MDKKPEKEVDDLTKRAIANCVCCLIRDSLKFCKTCPFNVGLEERAKVWGNSTEKQVPITVE